MKVEIHPCRQCGQLKGKALHCFIGRLELAGTLWFGRWPTWFHWWPWNPALYKPAPITAGLQFRIGPLLLGYQLHQRRNHARHA